jgi:DNA topoisomerase-1
MDEKNNAESKKTIKEFPVEDGVIQVLNGRYGPYIAYNKKNYRIPKNTDPQELTVEQCREIITAATK